MLERMAVRRLESGGLRLLRGGRSRKRMLHSAFWVHGGGELDLAAAAASLFGGGVAVEDILAPEPSNHHQGATTVPLRRNDLVSLDFLYPSGALALLRHLTTALPRQEPRRVFALGCAAKREYSSSTQAASPETAERPETLTLESSDTSVEWKPARPAGEKFNNLKELIQSHEQGLYDSIWYHYCNSNKKERAALLTHVSRYLLRSTSKRNLGKVVALLKAIEPTKRKEAQYEDLVKALLRMDRPQDALDVLTENIRTAPHSRNSGFEVFLLDHIWRGDWRMALRAYYLLRGSRYNTEDRRQQLNSTAMPGMTLASTHSWETYVDKVLDWASAISKHSPRQTMLDEDLAEDLVKGCLSYITRPNAEWTDYWETVWMFIRDRKGWLMTKAAWERTLAYLAFCKKDALATYRYMRYRGHRPSKVPVKVLNGILRCYARMHDIDGLQLVFNDIYALSAERQPDRESYAIAMTTLAKRGDAKALDGLFEEYVKLYPVTTPEELSHNMQVYATRGELEEVVMWFTRFTEHGVKPDIVSYNIMIDAYRKAGDVDGASKRVQEMLDAGLQPDIRTFNMIMEMCARRGDVIGAENVFSMIRQRGLTVTSYSYQALVTAYVNVKELDKADEVLEVIADQKFEHSPTPIWNTVISGHAAANDPEGVNALFKLMHDKQIPFDYYTYGVVMHSLCVAGKMEAAEDTLNYMKEAGFHLSSDKYAILMVGYTRIGDFRKVWEIFRSMVADGLSPDFNTLAVLLKSYALAEVEEHAEVEGEAVNLVSTERLLGDVLSEVRALDLRSFDAAKAATPPWLFTPLINTYAKKFAWGRSIRLFNRFLEVSNRERGQSPNLQMYKAMMQVYRGGNDSEGVQSMWQGLKTTAYDMHKSLDLRSQKRRPILEPFRNELCGALSIYIKTMTDARDISAIDSEIEEVQRDGYKLDNVNWNDYVQALAVCGRLAEATTVCEKNLMRYWQEVRMYFFYSDASLRGNPDGGEVVLPTIRPFVRTIESIATELRRLDAQRRRGDQAAKAALVEIYRNAPDTWEACDGLEDIEGRASKEMLYRLRRSSSSTGQAVGHEAPRHL